MNLCGLSTFQVANIKLLSLRLDKIINENYFTIQLIFATILGSCKDSIRDGPKIVLGSHVEGLNNIICRAWV